MNGLTDELSNSYAGCYINMYANLYTHVKYVVFVFRFCFSCH